MDKYSIVVRLDKKEVKEFEKLGCELMSIQNTIDHLIEKRTKAEEKRKELWDKIYKKYNLDEYEIYHVNIKKMAICKGKGPTF